MNEIIEAVNRAVADAQAKASAAVDAAALEALRIEYFGRNGLFQELSKKMGSVPKEEKKDTGMAFNSGRNSIQAALDAANSRIGGAGKKEQDAIDLTLPGRRNAPGHRHPITQLADECVSVFRRMGFVAVDGPEIEDIYHNFDALNTPDDHPSRDPKDTFYFPDGRILRSQTSPVQIRVMETHEPPVRIVAPGRVFRRDTPDATHGMNFHQIEGLYIDKNVSFADMKQSLLYFSKELFGEKTQIRMRPSYFPFTEPSAELDVSCNLCGGKGCPVCKGTGWLEIMGCGMVDPNVLEANGIDSKEYSGFAFGMGVERIAMLKFGVKDLRLYFENDVRFLHQFDSVL